MDVDSSRNPKLVSIYVHFFSFQSEVRGARRRHLLSSKASKKLASGELASGSGWTKAPSSWLSRPGCVAESTEGPCLVSLVQAVALESLQKVWETRKCPGTEGASPKLQGQKAASFCLS